MAAAGVAGSAQADINVGVTLSATGPAASLGIPEKNTFELLPTTIGAEKVNWIVLDDGSDTTKAVTNTKKLISENKVDVIVGSTITPNSLAMVDVAAEAETPMISMAASARIVDPTNPKTKWVFKTPQNDALMADAIAVHMKANGVKTMAYIGFADAYGDGWLAEIKRSAQTAGIKIVAEEKVQPKRLVGDRPDPQDRRRESRRRADRRRRHTRCDAAEGARRARLQGEDLPDARDRQSGLPARGRARTATARSCPSARCWFTSSFRIRIRSRRLSAEYIVAYEKKFGPDSRRPFGGHAWDAYLLLAKAIPEALKKAKPGTKEFKVALRDALENTKELVATHGVYTMSPTEHNGLDNRARTMIKIENGKWVLAK
jgi:branched-chain amino acid transport system substrate-binding protein